MKKIYLMSAVALLSLAACSDYDDQFHLDNQIADTKKDLPIVLEASDYATIASLSANKALADSLDKSAVTTVYSEALSKLGTTKYFGSLISADLFIPAFIQNKFQSVNVGSTFKVTYNEYCGKSEYLSDFANLSDYTLTADDYNTIWAGASTATYLTPSTETKLTQALASSYKDAQAGDIVVVNYSYSDFEPAGGDSSDPVEKYDKISDVVANTAGGEYTVKGKVPATYKRGFLLNDGTGSILVYKTSDDVSVGDEVAVTGTTSQYGGLMQFPNSSEVTVVKKGTGTYTHPTAKQLTAADFESYASAPYVAYVTYTGILTISGNYYNVAIEGTEKQGSLAYVPDGMVSADLNGKDVVVYGYSVGSASSGKYLNTMVTSVTAASSSAKTIRRAASTSKTNKAAVYRYDGTKWSAYTTSDASVIAAQPQWYETIGSTSISKPDTYLPTFIQQKYPFATDGQKVAVVYKKSASALAVVEYTYSAADGAWAASKEYKTETTTFAKTETGIEAKISMYLNETLLGSDGGFVAYNVNLGTLSYVWTNTTSYGWKGSAYSSGNHAAESWLVSPPIYLKKAVDPVLYFDEAMNYLGTANINDHLTVKVSKNFDETDVSAATWETLELTGRTDGSSWTFYTVDPVSLQSYNGSTIHIAFVYKSTDATAPTYEFKNIVVKEKDAEE